MAWFKKKKEVEDNLEEPPRLPEFPNSNLPSIPSNRFRNMPENRLPEIPLNNLSEINSGYSAELPDLEVNSLPSLPGSESEKRFSKEIIKNAINKSGMQRSNFPQDSFAKHLDNESPEIGGNITPRTIELSAKNHFIKPIVKKAEPIYIRLDKFETTVDAFEEIKNKINEIEKLLIKTRDIKSREEAELEEWEREIQIIKSRIESIDRDIFNKLD